jgi:hypothetical protein
MEERALHLKRIQVGLQREGQCQQKAFILTLGVLVRPLQKLTVCVGLSGCVCMYLMSLCVNLCLCVCVHVYGCVGVHVSCLG